MRDVPYFWSLSVRVQTVELQCLISSAVLFTCGLSKSEYAVEISFYGPSNCGCLIGLSHLLTVDVHRSSARKSSYDQDRDQQLDLVLMH